MVEVGRVLRAHGVRGVLRVRAHGETLAQARALYIAGARCDVEWIRPERQEWLVKLVGVDDRDRAEALRGQPLCVGDADRPPPLDDEVYVADLIGCHVLDPAGRELGVVRASFDSGAHEILEVRTGDGREFMLPFVDAMIVSVDVAARKIVCDPPPGLVDLDQAE